MARFPARTWGLAAAFGLGLLVPDAARALDYGGPRLTYYQVSGSAQDVLRQMAERGHDGHFGYTDYRIDYRYDTQATSAGCRVSAVKVKLRIGIRMPRLAAGESAPEVKHQWDGFKMALLHHEMGHESIIVAGARQIEAELHRASGSNCSVTQAEAEAAAKSMLAGLQQQNDAYDRQTAHGATQGAVFAGLIVSTAKQP